MSAVINSIIDLDLYKITQMQLILHQFPKTNVKFKFKCRNENIDFTKIVEKVRNEINNLENLKLTDQEFIYLNGLKFIKTDFLYFLKDFRLKPREFVKISPNMDIEIEGPWIQTTLFEIFILAIINELYFEYKVKISEADWSPIRKRKLKVKLELLTKAPEGFMITEFGTRRRFSREWQEYVIRKLLETGRLAGTSNIHLAMKYNIVPIGTISHELLQAGQATHVRLIESQKYMLDVWAKEYRGDLGIALTDVIGMDAFLKDFDMFFAKLYDGCRHDSGDPYIWARKLINHYNEMGIDSRTKTAIWSDGLNIQKSIDLYNEFNDLIKCGFGIGTDLTNDCGFTPLQIVIKMIECNNQPVAKISDSIGKTMCENDAYTKYLREVFNKND